MRFKAFLFQTFIFFCISIYASAQSADEGRVSAFDFNASYTGSGVQNFHGGIKTGSAYLGMANIKVGARLWKGGYLFVNGANTHGATPSADYIGDAQVAMNIEAGEHSYFHEFWYKQELGNFAVTLGLQDLNAEFVISKYGGLFLNSSFGIPSTIPANIPAPVFPFTSLGAMVRWEASPKIAVQAAIINAPTDFESNPHNFFWKFNEDDGFMMFGELHYSTSLGNNLQGTYKLGTYGHNHHNEGDGYVYNYGFYAIADQQLWNSADNNRSLGAFLQLVYNPKKNEGNNCYYVGGGLCYSGMFKRKNDTLGLAFALAGFDGTTSETAIELSYKVQLTENIAVQPDIQYIVNPMGLGYALPNAFVGALNFKIAF